MKKTTIEPGLAPLYLHSAIRGLAALSKALGVRQNVLEKLALSAETLYRVARSEVKSDGSIRQTYDALPRLKAVQIRIKERLLQRVIFPSYLHGSLRERSPRTNAATHIRAKITFAEDISNFFPSASRALVHRVWKDLFGFSEDVAALLTTLTTKDGGLPQGAVTSSYLANLIFWDYEPDLVKTLALRGLRYSRYVDDITVSSRLGIKASDKTYVISQIYGMLLHHGFTPKRKKHEITSAAKSMRTTKLVHHTRVSLPITERKKTRAAVYALELRVSAGESGPGVMKELASVSTRVGRLGSFHKTQAMALKKRLDVVRATLNTFEASPTVS
ncbi:reverse transcriptase family protein [Massilia sp. BSC265]|uniref:reverse transcriptase family protein n=1 Tax=Massilia sp. BSC265 TaxID=1549812 RepID=UPI0009DE7AB8|nr:reverse transcriptase family protein [Massilia sp. BSC265]